MRKNDLFQSEGSIFRILSDQEDPLVIDCINRTMPVRLSAVEYDPLSVVSVSEDVLLEKAGRFDPVFENASPERRKVAFQRYSLIAGIIPSLTDKARYTACIDAVARDAGLSKVTIRRYLCDYLVFQNIACLLPADTKGKPETLTQDQKNMRWSLNRYYYSSRKNTLRYAYTSMLRERYCDETGKLLPEYPSFHQYRYFYRKHKKTQTVLISRNGLSHYQRNSRPLLGGSVQDWQPCIGAAYLDGTILDIYLVNEEGKLVGRPVLTTAIDVNSELCCGYCLSWKGGVYNLRNLMLNVISDKVEYCKKFGVEISAREWPCCEMPGILITDKGSDFVSENFTQLAELGVQIVDLQSYRAELKSLVEVFNRIIQDLWKPELKGKGVIEPDWQERGSHDYRKDACLTLAQFEKILVRCIIFYNAQRILEGYPMSEKMLQDHVKPIAADIWRYKNDQGEKILIPVIKQDLVLTLLPRTDGRFSRDGLRANGLRYRSADDDRMFTERYLSSGSCTVAYSPDDVTTVYLLDAGVYLPFKLIDTRFIGKSLPDVEEMKGHQKTLIKENAEAQEQARVDLSNHIRAIAGSSLNTGKTSIKGIRQTRKKEERKTHKPIGGELNE